MDITLDPELEQRLQYKVAHGEYPSATAALNEAVRRLLEPEQEREDWLHLSQQRLAEAYSDDEPDYPLSCIREMNPDYDRR